MKRIYHPWNVWECYKAGFYNSKPPKDMSNEEAEIVFISFFQDLVLFDKIITEVFNKWRNSCEHFLTNQSLNRIAWLGQACVCLYAQIPSKFKGSFYKLSKYHQDAANQLAEKRINEWTIENERKNIKLHK